MACHVWKERRTRSRDTLEAMSSSSVLRRTQSDDEVISSVNLTTSTKAGEEKCSCMDNQAHALSSGSLPNSPSPVKAAAEEMDAEAMMIEAKILRNIFEEVEQRVGECLEVGCVLGEKVNDTPTLLYIFPGEITRRICKIHQQCKP